MKYFLFLLAIFIFIYDILKNNNKNSIENFNQKETDLETDLETDCEKDKIKSCKINTSSYDSIHPHFFSWNNLNLEY